MGLLLGGYECGRYCSGSGGDWTWYIVNEAQGKKKNGALILDVNGEIINDEKIMSNLFG